MYRLFVASVCVAVAISGCSDAAKPAANTSNTPIPQTAQPSPLPSAVGKVVLTLSGLTADPSKRAAVSIDLATLDAMSTVEDDIYEPFVKKTVHFTGVPLAALLARVGVTQGQVLLHALDDYTFNSTVAALTASQALIATTADGKPIPLAAGGPIRIVFPDGTALAKKTAAWVWSLDSIKLTSG